MILLSNKGKKVLGCEVPALYPVLILIVLLTDCKSFRMEVVHLPLGDAKLRRDFLNRYIFECFHLENLRYERILPVDYLTDFSVLHLALKLVDHSGIIANFFSKFDHLLIADLIGLVLIPILRIRALLTTIIVWT